MDGSLDSVDGSQVTAISHGCHVSMKLSLFLPEVSADWRLDRYLHFRVIYVVLFFSALRSFRLATIKGTLLLISAWFCFGFASTYPACFGIELVLLWPQTCRPNCTLFPLLSLTSLACVLLVALALRSLELWVNRVDKSHILLFWNLNKYSELQIYVDLWLNLVLVILSSLTAGFFCLSFGNLFR